MANTPKAVPFVSAPLKARDLRSVIIRALQLYLLTLEGMRTDIVAVTEAEHDVFKQGLGLNVQTARGDVYHVRVERRSRISRSAAERE